MDFITQACYLKMRVWKRGGEIISATPSSVLFEFYNIRFFLERWVELDFKRYQQKFMFRKILKSFLISYIQTNCILIEW